MVAIVDKYPVLSNHNRFKTGLRVSGPPGPSRGTGVLAPVRPAQGGGRPTPRLAPGPGPRQEPLPPLVVLNGSVTLSNCRCIGILPTLFLWGSDPPSLSRYYTLFLRLESALPPRSPFPFSECLSFMFV